MSAIAVRGNCVASKDFTPPIYDVGGGPAGLSLLTSNVLPQNGAHGIPILGYGHSRSHSVVGQQTELFEQFEKRLGEREEAASASIDRLS